MDRKLQIFVSSTYTDLIKERQAAVEAILTAGHIPAGMELFSSGDESQMEVIQRWIEESDVYLLILGGRYGSIDVNTGKSYTEIEYDYAVSINKPFFACVVSDHVEDERVKLYGTKVLERENPSLLREFRHKVTSKICRFWEDTKDIKLSILETLSRFEQRKELIGWVRGNEPANAAILAEEVARLAKENMELRQQLHLLKNTDNNKSYEEYLLALNWDRKTRFRESDLSKRDLANLDFYGAEFIRANLCETVLENVILQHANLMMANLEGANLQGADLQNANLQGANLEGADLRRARYDRRTNWPDGFDYGHSGAIGPEANLQEADLKHINLQGADLEGADLQKADLQGVNLQESDLRRASLFEANLQGTNLQSAKLQGANLQRVNLQGSSLRFTDLQNSDLQGANLEGADLSCAKYNKKTNWPDEFDYGHSGAIGPEADLREVVLEPRRHISLRGADLQGANLQILDLTAFDLQETDLKEANLQGADLQAVNLQGANLEGANLRLANLFGADLRKANLKRANLQEATLQRANLFEVDLQEADLWKADIFQARYNGQTNWPDGFDYESSGALRHIG